ncbi:MAG: site-specific DNA-methyltransferase, partial [Dehalococcoidia bacterium]
FFYCAKASRGERNAGLEGMEEKITARGGHGNIENDPVSIKLGSKRKMQNDHPTVKPIKLFEYLIKLVTREGQIVLDPFIGSGTTAIAAHNVGRKCVGIEKEDEYLIIAKRRIDYWKSQPQQLALGGKDASI